MKNVHQNKNRFSRKGIVKGMRNLQNILTQSLVKMGLLIPIESSSSLSREYDEKLRDLSHAYDKFGFPRICELDLSLLKDLHQIKTYENRSSIDAQKEYQKAYDAILTYQTDRDLYFKTTDRTANDTKQEGLNSALKPTKLKVALAATAGLIYSCGSFFTLSDAHIIARRDQGIEELETYAAYMPARILAEHTLAEITKEPLKFSPDKKIDLAGGLEPAFNQHLPEIVTALETKQVYSLSNIELPIKGEKITSPTMTATVIFTPPKHIAIAVVENGKPVTSNVLDVEIAIESAFKKRDTTATANARYVKL